MIPRLDIHFTAQERKWFRQGREYSMPKGEYWLNHCRSGLVLAMQALDLKPQTGVGMMVYNCHTVMNAIWQAGCKPVFVDITDSMTIDLDDLARKREQMQVLIVTHLFGIVNDVKEIKRRYPDLIVIEDCAHCFEHEIDGDFGVYSVGQGKFPSIGDGGILKVRGERLKVIGELYDSLPSYSRKQEAKLYLRLWMKAMMYSPCLYWLTRKLKQGKSTSVVPTVIPVKKMSRGIANILTNKREGYSNAVQSRLRNAQQIENALIGENAFMAVVRCEDPIAMKAVYASRGIETATHFSRCIDWAKQFGYVEGSCPNAEKLTQKLLMIPTYTKI